MAAVSRSSKPLCGRCHRRNHKEDTCFKAPCQTFDLDFGGCGLQHLHREQHDPFLEENEFERKKKTAVHEFKGIQEVKKGPGAPQGSVCTSCMRYFVIFVATLAIGLMFITFDLVNTPVAVEVNTMIVETYTRGFKSSEGNSSPPTPVTEDSSMETPVRSELETASTATTPSVPSSASPPPSLPSSASPPPSLSASASPPPRRASTASFDDAFDDGSAEDTMREAEALRELDLPDSPPESVSAGATSSELEGSKVARLAQEVSPTTTSSPPPGLQSPFPASTTGPTDPPVAADGGMDQEELALDPVKGDSSPPLALASDSPPPVSAVSAGSADKPSGVVAPAAVPEAKSLPPLPLTAEPKLGAPPPVALPTAAAGAEGKEGVIPLKASPVLLSASPPLPSNAGANKPQSTAKEAGPVLKTSVPLPIKECDMTKGRWVYDETYPQYNISKCTAVLEPYKCHKYGRQHVSYAKYRWQPEDCDLPRFDALDFLKRMRNERVVFLGDSMARNQFQSLAGLLYAAETPIERIYTYSGQIMTYKLVAFNFTLQFIRSNFLAYQGEVTKGFGNEKLANKTVRVDEIDPMCEKALGARLIVFCTGAWWASGRIFDDDYRLQRNSRVDMNLTVKEAYQITLKTFRQWAEKHIDFNRTRLVFQGESPTHFRRGDWRSGSTCGEFTNLVKESEFPFYGGIPKNTEAHLAFSGSNIPILDVGRMSLFRADAHIVYSEGIKRPSQDCRHWCLPGPPDAWNQILVSQLLWDSKAAHENDKGTGVSATTTAPETNQSAPSVSLTTVPLGASSPSPSDSAAGAKEEKAVTTPSVVTPTLSSVSPPPETASKSNVSGAPANKTQVPTTSSPSPATEQASKTAPAEPVVDGAKDLEALALVPLKESPSPLAVNASGTPTNTPKGGATLPASTATPAQKEDLEELALVSLKEKTAPPSGAKLDNKPKVVAPVLKTALPPPTKDCDLTKGRWVYDETYPLYNISQCKLIQEPYKCHLYGRQHVKYAKYRWQPQDCSLPRFDARKFLERMRNDRVVFLGDSMAKNQFSSLVGLLTGAGSAMEVVIHNSKVHIFSVPDFNFTIEFYRSSFLVHQGEVTRGYGNEKLSNKTIRVDEVDEPACFPALGAGVIIVNTGAWWSDARIFNEDYRFQRNSRVDMKMTVKEALQISLRTVRAWLEEHVNFTRSRIFFRGISPTHFRRGDWRSKSTCDQYMVPISEGEFSVFGGVPENADARIALSGSRIEFLDISRMSLFRADAHVVYSEGQKRPIQDCRHWCLPGPPDAWNEMVNAHLMWGKRVPWKRSDSLPSR